MENAVIQQLYTCLLQLCWVPRVCYKAEVGGGGKKKNLCGTFKKNIEIWRVKELARLF